MCPYFLYCIHVLHLFFFPAERLRLTDPKAPKLSRAEKKEKMKEEMKEKRKEEKAKAKNKKMHNFEENTPEGRMEREMQKISLLQARLAKRKRKPKKINTIYDSQGKSGAGKKKASSFDTDLTDTSRKNLKKIRHE